MEYWAISKYIRTSTRKIRLITDSIRHMKPDAATRVLSVMPKAGAGSLQKTILSAIANAKEKNAKSESLTFKTIDVMEGPVMKRWRAVSRGMAHGYKKRMTHIRVVLTDEEKK